MAYVEEMPQRILTYVVQMKKHIALLLTALAAASVSLGAQDGDVWLFSGQSNMELPISRCMDVVADDVKDYTCDELHYLKVPLCYNFDWPQKKAPKADWQTLDTPETSGNWGALCYFTARYLHERTGREISVINSSVGGSPIEAWLPAEELPESSQTELRRIRDPKWLPDTRFANSHIYSDWQNKINALPPNTEAEWHAVSMFEDKWGLDADGKPVYGSHYLRNTFKLTAKQAAGDALLRLGAMRDSDSTFVNGHYVGNITYQYPPRNYSVPSAYLHKGANTVEIHLYAAESRAAFVPGKQYCLETKSGNVPLTEGWEYKEGIRMPRRGNQVFIQYEPSGLFNAMIAPYTDMPVKGVVWYQGESNEGRPAEYAELLKRMITSWRKAFGNPELPFYIVELAAFRHSERETAATSGWVGIQDAQRQVAAEMDNVYLVPNRDLGEWNDIHPQDKKTLGARTAELIINSHK